MRRAFGYPHKPLVSYRINRQPSGWILPPLIGRTAKLRTCRHTSLRV